VALHELATNAANCGSLSVAKGQVGVTWFGAPDGRPDPCNPQLRRRAREIAFVRDGEESSQLSKFTFRALRFASQVRT
jgi:two-component sensor histidine kinase